MTEKNFFTSLPYLIFISLATLAIWYFQVEHIGMLVYVGIIFVLLLLIRNTIYIIPFLMNILFMISQTEWDVTAIPLYFYIGIPVLNVGIIGHVIRFKVSLFGGQFFIGIAFLAIAAIISTIINTETYDMMTLLIFLIAIFLVFLYGFFANTVKGDHLVYLIKIFAVLGAMISIQVAIFYIRTEDIQHALETKSLDLGWGLSNFVATYLIMFIATTTYFIKKFKLHIFWIVLSLFEVTMLLFTLSRAGIIAFLMTSIMMVIFMFVKYDRKWNLFLNLVIGVVLVSTIAYFLRSYFITIWERLELFGLDDNGRIDLWTEAWDKFRLHPIFGAGIFARSLEELRLYHNTVLNILAWFGALGGVALLIQFVSLLRIFLTKINQRKAILLIALIGVNLHGMVDNIYMMPQYMIILFVTVAFVENATKVDLLRDQLRVS